MGISVLIIFIIFLFNNAMKDIVETGCPLDHGSTFCPAYETITQQTYLSLGIVGLLILVGLTLVLSKPEEKVIVKRIKEKEKIKQIDTSQLNQEEKQALDIIKNERTIFQADLIERTGFGKAKVTRILDKLENKDIIERKRRGMTNIVVLKI